MNNPYDNIRYGNFDSVQPFMQGMQMAQQIGRQNALSQYAANPDDPEAMKALSRYDPQTAIGLRERKMRLQQEQQQQLIEQRRNDFLLGGQIFRGMQVKDEASYQQALQTYQRMGGNMADVPTTYDPNYVQGVVQVADQLKPPRQDSAPSSVQEYEYARQNGFQGTYMQFMEEKRGPLAVHNENGTVTLYPRGTLTGGAPQGGDMPTVSTPDEAMRLPPGTKFRMPDGRIGTVPGGAGSNASGGFPAPLSPQ